MDFNRDSGWSGYNGTGTAITNQQHHYSTGVLFDINSMGNSSSSSSSSPANEEMGHSQILVPPYHSLTNSSFDQRAARSYYQQQTPIEHHNGGLSLMNFQQNANSGSENNGSRPVVDLENKDLWHEFNEVGTEMIIHKKGRVMFPHIRVSVDNLEPESMYVLSIEIVPSDNSRYTFSNGSWLPTGKAEPIKPGLYIHPDSPATGSEWMKKIVTFKKLKLTNTLSDNNDYAVLNSMHKYQPCFHITKISNGLENFHARYETYVFKEIEFMAVTAYQNKKITKLKIKHNPFAKGFRDDGAAGKRPRSEQNVNNMNAKKWDKRKRQKLDENETDPTSSSNMFLDVHSSAPAGCPQYSQPPPVSSTVPAPTQSFSVHNGNDLLDPELSVTHELNNALKSQSSWGDFDMLIDFLEGKE